MTERGWPSFMDGIDERKQEAREAGGKGTPPPEWQPDPTQPAPPAGSHLWTEHRQAISPETQDSWLAMAGGAAVFFGSLMPFASFTGVDAVVSPTAKTASVICGLVLVALGFVLRAAPRRGRLVAGIAITCLSAVAGLLYMRFILAGITGVPVQDPFGDATSLTFSPDIGIILAVAGCASAYVAAIRSFHHQG